MRRRRRKPISSINVVPYLDVLLVLLVIFIITTPLFSQGVIDLPSVGDRPLPQATGAALEVLYEKDAAPPYRLKDYTDGGRESGPLTLDDLVLELKKKSILYEEPTIIISAERTLQLQEVTHLLGVLRDAGYDNLALAAETQ